MIVGVDLSTHAVDLVKLSLDDDRAEWIRVPLEGENAVDRARSYVERAPDYLARVAGWDGYWSDVILVALEDPAGRGDTRKIARVQGVVLASIPAKVHAWVLQPAEWRKACGLPGNSGKPAVWDFATERLAMSRYTEHGVDTWYEVGGRIASQQDACDAYCIAYAARAINQTQEDAA